MLFFFLDTVDEEGKPIGRYRKRVFKEWGERVLFGPTEQCVLDQAKAIRKNVWLSELELHAINFVESNM